ncbi:Hemolysin-type calcium-binding region:Cadherin, partial [sediment metagenome]
MAGEVYIYEINGATIAETQVIRNDYALGTGFGSRVSSRGDQLIVSSPGKTFQYLHSELSNQWELVSTLDLSDDAGNLDVLTDGTLIFIGAPNNDQKGTDAGAVRVSGTSNNNPPTGIQLTSAGIAENSPALSTIGDFITVDRDGGTHSYSMAPGVNDNDLFQISGNTLASTVIFDYEAGSQYTIRVRSTDDAGLYFE